MDFPQAWEFIRVNFPNPKAHDPKCSWAQSNGGLLCDCHCLWDEVDRSAQRSSASDAIELAINRNDMTGRAVG